MKVDRAILGVLASGAVLRALATLGVSPTIYVDSVEYRGVALLGGHRRPWTVPLLHAAVGDGALRVLAHALLGAAAWSALALVVAEVVGNRWVRVGVAAAVVGTGLTSAVVNYDATITSETVAVSLTVLWLAAWLQLVVAPTVRNAASVVAVAVLFAFTRNDHPLLVAASVAPALALAFVARRDRARRSAWVVATVGLAVVATWSGIAANRNDEIERFNLALIMANRVVPDPAMLDWYVDRGMPLPPGVEPRVGLPGGDTVLAFADDVRWNRWAGRDGRQALARYLLTHPAYALFEPWPDVLGVQGTSLEVPQRRAALLSPGDAYGRSHRVLPAPLEGILWGRDDAGAVVVAVVGLAVYGVARGGWRDLRGLRRAARRLGPVRAVGAVGLLAGIGHAVLVWHASPNELGRLAMVPATTVHVSLLVLLASTVDRRLAPSSDGRA